MSEALRVEREREREPETVHSTEEMNGVVEDTRARILHVLSIYPFISGSMLQTGISPGLPPKLWRPVLEDLIEKGVVKIRHVSAVTPSERAQTYSVYHLAANEYTYEGVAG